MKKKKNALRIQFRVLGILSLITFFLVFFVSLCMKEGRKTEERLEGISKQVEEIIPDLEYNERLMEAMLEALYVSRFIYLGDYLAEEKLTQEVWEEKCGMLKLSAACLSDENGNAFLSYGGEIHATLPYKEGQVMADMKEDGYSVQYCTYGVSEDGGYFLFGGLLGDGKYLTMEVPGDEFEVIRSSTLFSESQLNLLGLCSDAEIYPVSVDEQKIVSLSDDESNGAKYREYKLPFSEASLFVFHAGRLHIVVGNTVQIGEESYLVSVSLTERVLRVLINTLQLTVLLGFLLVLFIRYIYYSVRRGISEPKEFKRSSTVFFVSSLLLAFSVSWFWLALCENLNHYADLDYLLESNATARSVYDGQQEIINKWLDEQFLMQCRIAADEVNRKRDELSRAELDAYAKQIGVEYVFLLDASGQVILTNSPYDHFRLSREEGASSSAFLPLLEGVDHVVLPVLADDISGQEIQYIGVSIRNEEDLCNGCVLVSMDDAIRDILPDIVSAENTLFYGSLGSADEVYLLDRETQTVLAASEKEYQGDTAEYAGIPQNVLNEETIVELRESDDKYIIGSKVPENNTQILVMKLIRERYLGLAGYALVITCFMALCMLLARYLGLKYSVGRENKEEDKTDEEMNVSESFEGELYEDERGFFVLSNLLKTNVKFLFDERWKSKKKDEKDMNTLELALHSMRGFGPLFGIAFLVPVLLYLLGFDISYISGLNYIFSGKWNNGLNVFSITQCLIMILAMSFIDYGLKQLLYQIARVSDTRVETICLLLRSSIKYVCVIIVVVFILSQMGINATTLLASAGVLTVVIGFGAKDITADLLSGFFLIFERAFDVGDFININGKYGIVSEIGLRTTKITKFADTLIINNSDVRNVINQSGAIHRVSVDVSIPYETDLLDLEKKMEEALPEMLSKVEGLVRAPRYRGIQDLGDHGLMIRFSLYTVGYMRSRSRRAFLREFKLFLDGIGIRIPYQQIVVHETQD